MSTRIANSPAPRGFASRTGRYRSLLNCAILLGAATTATFADTINFENQCPSGQTTSGPCSALFSTVGNAETLTIPTAAGNVVVQGGALFYDITNLPADETAVYGTAGNASGIGVFPSSGFINPITITFPVALSSFSVDVLNGNTQSVEYQVADNRGNSADFPLAANFSAGLQTIGFAAAGNVVTISAATGQSTSSGMTWDFLIDNIDFTTQSSTTSSAPEPASAFLIGIGLLALGLARRGKNSRRKHVHLLAFAAIMLPVSSSVAAPAALTLACPNNGLSGVTYSSSLKATGGVPPYKFTVTKGSLPAGLTLNATTGAITGKPTAAGSSSFTATVVDSLVPGAGGQPNSTTAACTIIAFSMDSLSVKQPATPNAQSDAVPAVTPVTSTNTSAAFATAGSTDLVSVLKAGTITVTGNNIQPAANANQVQWVLERDPADKVDLTQPTGCTGNPTGAPAINGAPGAEVSFSPEIGNFHLVAYIDANGNGKFDDGEQLRILRIAVVRVTLLNQATSTFKTTKDFAPDPVKDGKAGVDTQGPAMKLLGDYLIEGGGATCVIGAAAITIGNVGNLTGDTFTIFYPAPRVPIANGTTKEVSGGPVPMVDTARVTKGNQPTGGITAFRGSSDQTVKASATGRRISLESEDSPGYGFWKVNHPATGSPWATTTGGNAFREFVAAFSSSFPRTYSSLNENTWTVTVNGKNDGTGKWKDDGTASVTGNDTKLTNLGDKIQVLGLSFRRQYSYVCDPAPPVGVSCN